MKQNTNSPISLPVAVKSWLAVLPLFFLIPAVPAAPVPPVLPAATIVERGPHSKTWQTVRAVQKGDQMILRTNSYQELGMGISYLQKGVWVDSEEVITVVNGQGVANQGLHQAVFSASIADSPAVTYTDPDGHIFRTRIMGLAYYDCTSGKSALLCETTPSIGQVQGNQVIYTNAFTDDVRADVRYTYKRGSFEQDIILRAQLPSPAVFGLNPQTTRLQVWNEFFDPPAPVVKETTFIYQQTDPAVRQAMVEPDFTDEFLSFGQMQFGHGRAFVIDSDAIRQAGINVAQEVPVGKEWTSSPDGRRFLLESVEFAVVEPLLGTLPATAAVKPTDRNRGLAARVKQGGLPRTQFLVSLPKREERKPSGEKLQMAQATIASPRSKGVAIDYVTLITTNNFTFAADTTYYIASTVTLSGTNTLEGGTVLKFSTNGLGYDPEAGWTNIPVQINITGSGATLNCKTSQWRPAVFTAVDDDTCGDIIDVSTGSPTGYYGTYYIFFDGVPSSLSNVRMLYAATAICYDYGSTGSNLLTHSQFSKCLTVLNAVDCVPVLARNVLVANCSNFLTGWYFYARVEHLTASSTTNLFPGGSSCYLYLTNSLLYNVVSTNYSGGANIANPSSNPFQTVGAGAAYLASGSSYRNAGTTNINPTLLSDLGARTTYPPIMFPHGYIGNTNLVLSPQAGRDTDTPDLGYHYDPIDYMFGWAWFTNSTIVMTNAVVIGTFSTVDGGAGLVLDAQDTLISQGAANALNRIVRYNTVQEQETNSWSAYICPSILTTYLGNAPTFVQFRFTDWSMLAEDSQHLWGYESADFAIAFRDCQFHGGQLLSQQPVFNITNCLFERVAVTMNGADYPLNPTFHNCTFYGGSLVLDREQGGTWTLTDNLFDKTVVTNGMGATLSANYNGYLTNFWRIIPTGSNDVVLTTNNVGYQSSWLGNYYLPTNSPFIDKGSLTNAALVGLYHYTTLTNQTIEATNKLDIGFHVVATDSSGNPLDANSDGIPNYLQDLNGNGTVDSGETDWRNAGDWGLRVLITRPRNGSIIP